MERTTPEQLSALMQGCLGTSVEVTTCQQIFGGASRETFLVTADIDAQTRDVVVRCEQAAGLIDTQVTTEVWALEQVADIDLPAPKVLGFTECTDEQTGVLVLERLPGEAAGLTVPDPYAGIEDTIGKDFWRHLGTMVRHTGNLPTCDGSPPPAIGTNQAAAEALDYWEDRLQKYSMHPEPVIDLACRRLRENLPISREIRLVHGDYRTGNFLYDQNGITGILDWEMAHLGDPHEDLGWAMTPLFAGQEPEKLSKLIPYDRAIEHWSSASQLTPDPEAMKWWSAFACVKGLAIWIAAGYEFAHGNNSDPINLVASWGCTPPHLLTLCQSILADYY